MKTAVLILVFLGLLPLAHAAEMGQVKINCGNRDQDYWAVEFEIKPDENQIEYTHYQGGRPRVSKTFLPGVEHFESSSNSDIDDQNRAQIYIRGKYSEGEESPHSRSISIKLKKNGDSDTYRLHEFTEKFITDSIMDEELVEQNHSQFLDMKCTISHN
jgi:hypothetical protein